MPHWNSGEKVNFVKMEEENNFYTYLRLPYISNSNNHATIQLNKYMNM